MKKTIVVIVLVVFALAAFATGIAFAQAPQPGSPGGGRGQMGGSAVNGVEGPLHDYMVNAVASALGISVNDFEAGRAADKTAYQIALDLGISADKVPALLRDARAKALDAAVADNVITQQQADWMKSRGTGMGQGNCNGTGQPWGRMNLVFAPYYTPTYILKQ